jgi:integron integrase
VRRFAKANWDRDFATLTAVDARLFLEALALKGTIAASTQNIAFNALLFLYKNVLSISLEGMGDTLRTKRPRTLPVVFIVEEARACLAQFEDPYLLVAELLYGCGLRLHEGLTIRVQELDLDNRMLTVRRGKGNKDRTVPLPESLVVRLRARLRQVRRKHEADCREIGFEGVTLPRAMQSRDARSRVDFAWYWLFPAAELSETDTGVMVRSHMHPRASQRAMRTAVERAGIAKRATPHTFRHSFATHLLLQGANICQVQQALGHADVRTTMIYLQVANLQAKPVVSPLDRLYGARGGNTAGTNGSQGKEVGRQEMD